MVGMRLEVLFHSGPEFSSDDDRNAGKIGIGQSFETGLVAEYRNAGAGIKEK